MYFFLISHLKVINTNFSEYQSYTLFYLSYYVFFNLTLLKVIKTQVSLSINHILFLLRSSLSLAPLLLPPPRLKNIAVASLVCIFLILGEVERPFICLLTPLNFFCDCVTWRCLPICLLRLSFPN